MRRSAVLSAALALAATVPVVHAMPSVTGGYVTGQQLHDECAAPDAKPSCLAYVSAILDMHDTLIAARMMPRLVCVPDETPPADIAAAVRAYTEGHADMLGNTGADVVLRALTSKWACQ